MPDNAIYYQLAYAAVALIYGTYAVSLVVRSRRLAERERRYLDPASSHGTRED